MAYNNTLFLNEQNVTGEKVLTELIRRANSSERIYDDREELFPFDYRDITDIYSPYFMQQKVFILKNIFKNAPYQIRSDLFEKVVAYLVYSTNYYEFDFLPVEQKSVGIVVGHKGNTIKYFQEISRCKIVSPTRDMEPIFMILGTKSSIQKAKTAIKNYITIKERNVRFKIDTISNRNPVISMIQENDQKSNETQEEKSKIGRFQSVEISSEKEDEFMRKLNSQQSPFDNYQYRPSSWMQISPPMPYATDPLNEIMKPYINSLCTPISELNDKQMTVNGFMMCIKQENDKLRNNNYSNRESGYQEAQRYTTRSNIFSETSQNQAPFCMICYSETSLKNLLPCKNGPFCQKCIQKMNEEKQKCPVCGREFDDTAEWTENNYY